MISLVASPDLDICKIEEYTYIKNHFSRNTHSKNIRI